MLPRRDANEGNKGDAEQQQSRQREPAGIASRAFYLAYRFSPFAAA